MLATRHEPASLDCGVADPLSALDAKWRACCSFSPGGGTAAAELEDVIGLALP
jgi:hypothetical protein